MKDGECGDHIARKRGRRAPEKVSDTCGFAFSVAPGGKYLFTLLGGAGKIGIYQLSLADGKCTALVPGVVTFGVVNGRDGKSFTYAIPSQQDVTIYRQGWEDGKVLVSRR